MIHSYKEHLLNALKESALLIAESEKYNNLCADYKEVKKLLDEKLASINGAYIKNSESYIDSDTGKFIPLGDIESSLDSQTKFMFSRFALLAKQLKDAKWKDESSHSVDVILKLGKFKNLQKELINKYGKYEAENFINTVILEMEDFEKEHKINVYTKEIFYIKEKNKIKCLRPITPIEVTIGDNVINSTVELFNDFHQSFLMKKSGQVGYENEIYFVLELVDKSKCREEGEFYFYKVNSDNNYQQLVMNENEEVNDILYERYERLTTQTLIEENKKKNK